MNLALFLLANTGQPFSLQNLTKSLAVPAVAQTARYVEYLQDAYVLFALPRFSPSFKQRVVAPNKFYAIDNGFRRLNSPQTTPDRGARLENAEQLTDDADREGVGDGLEDVAASMHREDVDQRLHHPLDGGSQPVDGAPVERLRDQAPEPRVVGTVHHAVDTAAFAPIAPCRFTFACARASSRAARYASSARS